MTKNNCIFANFILGLSIACINIVPQILQFDIAIITYVLIIVFDIIAVFLAFALDLGYAKANRFKLKDVVMFVITPLAIPTVIFAIIYSMLNF